MAIVVPLLKAAAIPVIKKVVENVGKNSSMTKGVFYERGKARGVSTAVLDATWKKDGTKPNAMDPYGSMPIDKAHAYLDAWQSQKDNPAGGKAIVDSLSAVAKGLMGGGKGGGGGTDEPGGAIKAQPMTPLVSKVSSAADTANDRLTAIAERQMALAEQQAARGEELYQRWKKIWAPLEEQFAKEAQAGPPLDYYAERSGADVQRAFENLGAERERRLRQQGIDLGTGRAEQAYQDVYGPALAAAKAGAMTTARERARALGQAQRLAAIDLGKGMPVSSSGISNLANTPYAGSGQSYLGGVQALATPAELQSKYDLAAYGAGQNYALQQLQGQQGISQQLLRGQQDTALQTLRGQQTLDQLSAQEKASGGITWNVNPFDVASWIFSNENKG